MNFPAVAFHTFPDIPCLIPDQPSQPRRNTSPPHHPHPRLQPPSFPTRSSTMRLMCFLFYNPLPCSSPAFKFSWCPLGSASSPMPLAWSSSSVVRNPHRRTARSMAVICLVPHNSDQAQTCCPARTLQCLQAVLVRSTDCRMPFVMSRARR